VDRKTVKIPIQRFAFLVQTVQSRFFAQTRKKSNKILKKKPSQIPNFTTPLQSNQIPISYFCLLNQIPPQKIQIKKNIQKKLNLISKYINLLNPL
jgi:hypothetical protein